MSNMSELAINGGPKTKTTPYATTQRFGAEELEQLREALEQNTLFYGFGNKVKQACELMQQYTGRPYVVACSSGTAAVHLSLIACGIGPGDEVILTPNTDSGSVIGIIAEGAVPVFCDCNENMQPDVASIAARITPRTRAVVVVHLAGYPAQIDEINALCTAKVSVWSKIVPNRGAHALMTVWSVLGARPAPIRLMTSNTSLPVMAGLSHWKTKPCTVVSLITLINTTTAFSISLSARLTTV